MPHPSRFLHLRRRLSPILILSFLIASLQVVTPNLVGQPASATFTSTVCGTYAGTTGSGTGVAGGSGSGADLGAFRVLPLHGKAFYLDLKNGINASYIGYEITYEGAGTVRNQWVELTGFRDSANAANSVLSLSNPADAIQPIGDFIQNQKRVVYFLIKGSAVSESIQRHDLRIHSGYPNGTSTISDSGNAQCRYDFTKVTRVLAAAANKVTSISVNTTSPVIGDSVVVTISGTPGTVGAGSSPDLSIFWLSGASSSQWPTRALRLEKTTLAVKINAATYTISDRLALLEIRTDAIHWEPGNQKITNKSSYTATFTFRVLGSTATNPAVRPVANIASGTQIKHTGTYPATQATINTSATSINMTSLKSISSISSDSSSGFWNVNYRVKLTDTASAITLDSIIDDPDTSVVFLAGSAKIIDATRSDTFTAIPNPKSETTTVDNYKYTFGGPFTGKKVGSSYEIELIYTMRIPTTLAATAPEVFNRAYGLIGSTIVGNSTNLISAAKITLSPTGEVPSKTEGLTEGTPRLPQEIQFPTPPAAGVGQVVELNAVASSGLSITYTSLTSSVCTISGNTVIYIASGTCSLQANQSGNDQWFAADPVTVNIVVKPGQTITFNPTSPLALAATQVVSLSATSGLAVTVEVISTDVCALNSAKNLFTATGSSITIHPITSGQCVLVASQAGNDSFGPAPSVERTVAIGAQQYIDFVAITDKEATSGTGTLTATSKKSSDNLATILPVSFISSTPDICDLTAEPSMNGSGVTTASFSWSKAGICIFVASQDGYNADEALSSYAPAADVTRSFKIGNTTPSVLVTPSLYEVNSEDEFTAVVRLTVPASGNLAGTLYLYASGKITSSFAIQQVSKSASLAANGTTDQSYNLKAGILPTGSPAESIALSASFVTSNSDFTSSSTTSDTFVSVVAPSLAATTGDVSSVTTSSASFAGTFNPRSASAAQVYVVVGTASNAMDTSGVTISAPAGESGTGSSNINVVAAKSGLEPATKYFYEVRATRDGFVVNGGVKTFVTKPATPGAISVSPQSNSAIVTFDTVTAGTDVTISYTVSCTPVGGGTTKTASGSTSPITVTGLTSTTNYNCEVKATSSSSGAQGGGDGGSRATSSPFATTASKTDRRVKIFSSDPSAGETNTVTITYGETATIYVAFEAVDGTRNPRSATATELGAGALTFTRQSGSSCSAAQVGSSETATVTFTGIGTCTFSAEVAENSVFSETATAVFATVVVVRKGLTAQAGSYSLAFGDPVPSLSASVTGFIAGENASNAAGYGAPTCTTTYTTSTDAETAGLTVTCSGGSANNYSFSHLAGAVTVAKANQTVALNALSNMVEGESNQSTTSSNDKSQAVILTASPSSICEVVGTSIRAKALGTCTVTAASSGTTNFNPSNTVTRTFTITAAGGGGGGGGGAPAEPASSKKTPTITWANPADIFNPTPLGTVQLNAVGSVPGRLDYSPALGTVLPVGLYRLSVTLFPTDSDQYNSVSTTVQIRVRELRYQTILTWNNPTPIAYPTPLSSTQLNARANTSGRFNYQQSIGSILDPGTYILRVDFEPTLNRTYPSASAEVTLIVTGTRPPGSASEPNRNPPQPTRDNPIILDTRTPVIPPTPNNSTPNNPVIFVDTSTVNSVEVKEKGRGIDSAEIKDGKIELKPDPKFSGKTEVQILYFQDGETKLVTVPITIQPIPPSNSRSSPESMDKSTIRWQASPNAISYDVYVRDALLCQVTANACDVPFIVGPATPIRVVVKGGDDTTTEVQPTYSQERTIPALTVNFATASSRLNKAFRTELDEIAEIISREGFTSLIVFGHTDSRNFDNAKLSRDRAKATRDYLANLLPGVKFRVAGFAATQKAAAENSRAGLAENRRAEVRIAG